MDWAHVAMAAGLGGVALFVWNAIAWMALPHHNKDFRRMPKVADVEKALESAGVTPGIYSVPHPEDFAGGFKDPALATRWAKGPNAWMVVSAPGPCMQGATFLVGFLLCVFQAAGVAIAFRYAEGNAYDLVRAVGFSAAIGLFVNGGVHLSQAVWTKMPWSHALKSAFDGVVGFALVGVVLHVLR